MGIRLDWEIEAEQSHIQRAGEDAQTARRRRVARLRVLLFILVLIAISGGLVFFVFYRLQAVDAEIAQALRDTVDAEVTALRLGDYTAFSAAQRSASDAWMHTQQALFDDYQTLKLQSNVQLTGQILDLTIDQTRARVKVQEIIDGVPYSRVWFYWRYDDGWRHVPPDYTFWGDVKTYAAQGVTVRYQSVDDMLASTLGDKVSSWLQSACAALTCGDLPALSVEIVPDESLQTTWSPNNAWVLQVPSPYITRARSDMPFDLDMQFAVANLLAERLVAQASNNMQPVYPTDAYYLRQAIVSWLVGKFVQVNTNAFIISSLATNYGDAMVGRLLAALQPNSSVALLGQVIGVASLDQANFDWRDYLTWRVVTEDNLIRQRDDVNFLALYDTRDDTARNLASQRFSDVPLEVTKVIVSAQLEAGADGLPILRAVMQVGEKDNVTEQEVIFRLADGVWKRLN
jgi:hypothetical protein